MGVLFCAGRCVVENADLGTVLHGVPQVSAISGIYYGDPLLTGRNFAQKRKASPPIRRTLLPYDFVRLRLCVPRWTS